MAELILKLKGSIPEKVKDIEQEIAAETDVSAINILEDTLKVIYGKKKPEWNNLINVIRTKGLDIETSRETFHVSGMACAACIKTVKTMVGREEGIITSAVNLASDQASVEFIPTLTNKKSIVSRIETAGFVVRNEQEPGDRELRAWRFRAIVSLVLMLPGFLISMGSFLFNQMLPGQWWILFFLSTPVVFGAGFYTLHRSLRSVMARSANMHLLVSLGTLSAYIYGLSSYFFEVFNLFSLAAMIMSFHLLGQYLNLKTKRVASRELKKLLSLQANTTTIRVGKREKEVKTEVLKPDDIVIVRPGKRVPVDGVVIEGRSVIDESMVTGESIPAEKSVNDEMIGGTVNVNGVLIMKVTKIGQDTFLSQMIRLGQEARWSKEPLLLFADKIIARFIPTILALSLITFFGWLMIAGLDSYNKAIFSAIALMVVASPCVIGLVTPTAFMTGAALGVRNGVVIKDMSGLEVMQRVTTVLFDKTGTITYGKPVVTDIITYHAEGENKLLQWGLSVERESEHPIGKSLVDYAETKGIQSLPIERFESKLGMGVKARVDNQYVSIGNKTLMKEQGVDITDIEDQVEAFQLEGKTAIIISVNNQVAGVLAVADTVKENAVGVIKRLKSMGLKPVMVTGDNDKTARSIAKQVGVEQVIANALPIDKVTQVRKMQERGETVIMVGDGINDGPALNQADVGIAIGGGTDVAVEAADLTLIKGNLNGLVTATFLGKNISRLVKQNLFWAFIFYLILFPTAAFGLFHPLMSAFAMLFSFLFVFGNTYRLKRITRKVIQMV
ncbi:heavy metal translocating P-type ATPase [Radiobacillus sp. PE A8.2]|uniref:heavy metal translocating P-type ATPase n=1 Tax=Radiobacillus sp. PE A8.2 TaxID=3380349 RepID=UPI00388F8AC3